MILSKLAKTVHMKLVSYLVEGHDQLGIYVDGYIYAMETLHPDLPGSMGMFLQYWEDSYPLALKGEEMVKMGRIPKERGIPYDAAYPTPLQWVITAGEHRC